MCLGIKFSFRLLLRCSHNLSVTYTCTRTGPKDLVNQTILLRTQLSHLKIQLHPTSNFSKELFQPSVRKRCSQPPYSILSAFAAHS